MAGALYVGTSGFAYPKWKGPFYPPNLRSRDMLPFYAERFRSVEINYSFRKEPEEHVLTSWREATPDGFVFSIKAPQRITHWLRLAGAEQAVASFLEAVRVLGPKLGPILFQCPPNLNADRGLLEGFLDALPAGPRYAFEFRHPSWWEHRELIRTRGAAWCVAETADGPFHGDVLPDGAFVYLRLRRPGYSKEELERWSVRIRNVLDRGGDAFCYFKHEEEGAGAALAARLDAMMHPPSAGQGIRRTRLG